LERPVPMTEARAALWRAIFRHLEVSVGVEGRR
jgi:hypothetical protein